jgi:hypothetical protein
MADPGQGQAEDVLRAALGNISVRPLGSPNGSSGGIAGLRAPASPAPASSTAAAAAAAVVAAAMIGPYSLSSAHAGSSSSINSSGLSEQSQAFFARSSPVQLPTEAALHLRATPSPSGGMGFGTEDVHADFSLGKRSTLPLVAAAATGSLPTTAMASLASTPAVTPNSLVSSFLLANFRHHRSSSSSSLHSAALDSPGGLAASMRASSPMQLGSPPRKEASAPGSPVPTPTGATGTGTPRSKRAAKKPMFTVDLSSSGHGGMMGAAVSSVAASPVPGDFNHFRQGQITYTPGPSALIVKGKTIVANLSEIDVIVSMGKGVHGSVSRVKHTPTSVLMAMKEIELGRIADETGNQIVRELDILKTNCPSIVEYYGAFCRQGSIYILMELMDLGALDQIIRQPTVSVLPEPIVAAVASSTIDALVYLKSALNMMHRDVKPSNILLNSQGQFKMCDFFVSGQLVQSCGKTYLGTMYYMAPE